MAWVMRCILGVCALATAVAFDGAHAQAPAGLYYIHVDHLNTPRAIYNDQQQLVWRWDQREPFGNDSPNENPSGLGAFECNLRFPGQYFDKETNLAYNYFRDFDPSLGRYVQSDPIGLAGGTNTYAYVGGNPLSNIDPTGEAIVAPIVRLIVIGGSIILSTPAGQKAAQSAAATLGKAIGAFCEPDDPCRDIQKRINDQIDLMGKNYSDMFHDPYNLYARAFSVNPGGDIANYGTWVGHVERYRGLRKGLQNMVDQANAMGCPVPPVLSRCF